MTMSGGGGPLTPAARAIVWGGRAIRQFAIVMVAANVLVPLVLFIHADYNGEAYWRMYRGERHAVDWFSSLQMVILAVVAYANYQLADAARRLCAERAARHRGMWAVFALGFLVLALDERFNIHEALRDSVFEPSGLFTEVGWLLPGDVGLYLVFFIGIACSVFLRDDLIRARYALAFFIAALALTLPTLIIDSLRDSAMAEWPMRRFLDYTFEEVGEIWAQLFFLLSFLCVFAWRLEGMSDAKRANDDIGP